MARCEVSPLTGRDGRSEKIKRCTAVGRKGVVHGTGLHLDRKKSDNIPPEEISTSDYVMLFNLISPS